MDQTSEPVEVYRKKGMRLEAELSPLLYKYFQAATAGKTNKGFQWFDKAHVVMLTEEGIVTHGVGASLLRALREMESNGAEEERNALGGYMHAGEAYVTRKLGPDTGGWIHTGRSSGDLLQVANRIWVRDSLIDLMKQQCGFRELLLAKAERHVDTVMPGYTHCQHAEPITLGFYLMSWVHQFERDFERYSGAYKHVNISPAGCAILTATDFPVSRERTKELLGFDAMYTNSKDAIWSFDHLLEVCCCLAGTSGIFSRFAEDLNLWHSSEFKMIDQPDEFCGTSSIMPQKKNPYGTETTRGLYAYIIGSVATYLSLSKCLSDAPDMTNMAMPPLFEEFSRLFAVFEIMTGVVSGLRVNEDLMLERAGMYWATATGLANALVKEKGLPFRHAHLIVSMLVRMAYEDGIPPTAIEPEMVDRAVAEYGLPPLQLDAEMLRKALDPTEVVRSKKVVGGTAPEVVRDDIASALERLEHDRGQVQTLEDRLSRAEVKLEEAIDAILAETPAGEEVHNP